GTNVSEPGKGRILKLAVKVNETADQGKLGIVEVLFNTSNAVPQKEIKFTVNIYSSLDLKMNVLSIVPKNVTAEDVSLNVSVRYLNGSDVLGLGKENFTVVLKRTDTGQSYEISPITVEPGYRVNFSVSNIPGGEYGVIVTAYHKRLKGSASTRLNITKPAFWGDVLKNSCANVKNGSTCTVKLNVTNFGFASGKANITLEIRSKVSILDVDGDGGCFQEISKSSAMISLQPKKSCTVTWTLKAIEEGGAYNYLRFVGLWLVSNRSLPVNVYSSTTSSTQPGTSQPTQEDEIKPDISFFDVPSEIKIERGDSEEIEFRLRNSGSVYLNDVTLYIEGINSSWYTKPGKIILPLGVTKKVKITFHIPKGAELGRYEIKFVADSSKVRKKFDSALIVLPDDETKREIEKNLTEINKTVSELLKSEDVNKTEIESVAKLVEQAAELVELGDYLTAKKLLDEAKISLEKAKTVLGTTGKQESRESTANFPLIQVIAVILVFAGGVVVYLMLPPSHGYEPEAGFKYVPPEERKPRIERLKERIKEFLERFKKKEEKYNTGV
ncbi:MAG: hypothetical protein GXO63_00620, partial [Candidatus Micrarchaeota archaeon]|nr:hypothetical protein [Candidatus Micrarchaeota archaeon]